MDESTLLLEVGSEAIAELSSDEKTAILAAYTNAQVKYAGLKVFELLMKKFQPTFRMGRMYKAQSDKFEAYRRIYIMYTQQVGAGKLAKDVDDDDTYEEIYLDRYKFLDDTHDT